MPAFPLPRYASHVGNIQIRPPALFREGPWVYATHTDTVQD